MIPTWVSLLTFVTVALFVGALASTIYDSFFRYHFLVNDRIDELAGKSKSGADAALFGNLKPLDNLRGSWSQRLEEYVEQSGLDVDSKKLLTIVLGVALMLTVGAAFVLPCWWMAPLVFVPSVVLPALYVRWRRAARMRRLVSQLPRAFDMIVRAVRAGQTISAAFQIVADELEAPLADEFLYCYEQQNLGMPYDAVLRGLAQRTGIAELRILSVALLVQARTGGNLVELVSNLSTLVTKRIKLQRRVKTLTSEGRMQATVLMVLPVLAFIAISVLAPDYAQTLVEHPWLLTATVSAQLVGAFWIQRCVSFEY
jgi:tight adherence protein B